MPKASGRLGVAHTPQGYQITLRGWSLDYVEADEITEWTATVVQRNPLLLKEDAVNELFFEADETGKVLFQGIGRLSREHPRETVMHVEGIGRLDHFPDKEHFPPDEFLIGTARVYGNEHVTITVQRHADDTFTYDLNQSGE